jgi:hypothetical protein
MRSPVSSDSGWSVWNALGAPATGLSIDSANLARITSGTSHTDCSSDQSRLKSRKTASSMSSTWMNAPAGAWETQPLFGDWGWSPQALLAAARYLFLIGTSHTDCSSDQSRLKSRKTASSMSSTWTMLGSLPVGHHERPGRGLGDPAAVRRLGLVAAGPAGRGALPVPTRASCAWPGSPAGRATRTAAATSPG